MRFFYSLVLYLGLNSIASQCRHCKEYGCTTSNHYVCGACGGRGHNRRTCTIAKSMAITDLAGSSSEYSTDTEMDTDSSHSSYIYGNKYAAIPLQRTSTLPLNQGEVDVCSRAMVACLVDAERGSPNNESLMEKAMRYTGIGETKMWEIRRELEAGKIPKAKEDKRGKWKRTEPRLLCTKLRLAIEELTKRGIMTTVAKIKFQLESFHACEQLSHTTIRRALRIMQYTWKPIGPMNIKLCHEKPEARQYRLEYLRKITEARKTYIVLYSDESYVNERHMANRCWLHRTTKVLVPQGKGKRYIMFACGSRYGWLGQPTVFANKGKGDYHDGMNGQHFKELFTTECQQAHEMLGPCVFILDNAAYHKMLTSEKDLPSYWTKLHKDPLLEAWRNNEVPNQELYNGPPIKFKKQVLVFLQEHPPKGKYMVHAIAEEYGHIVLFLPPYCPELNGIETAWGISKNHVASKNYPALKFADLKNLVDEGLNKVTALSWAGIDNKVIREEQKQLQELEAEESRREQFRQESGIVIHLGNNDNDSDDDESDDEILDEITEGVNGADDDQNVQQDLETWSQIHQAESAAHTLISLRSRTISVPVFSEE